MATVARIAPWVLAAVWLAAFPSCSRSGGAWRPAGPPHDPDSSGAGAGATGAKALAAPLAHHAALASRSVVDLQARRESAIAPIGDEPTGTATLVNLNPHVNAWFLLRLERAGGPGPEEYHLENPDPAGQRLLLDPQHPSGVVIVSTSGRFPCDLWSGGERSVLRAARRSGGTYAPLCGDRLILRNPTRGQRTSREWVAELLRDHVWRGDAITAFVKDTLVPDAALATADARPSTGAAAPDAEAPPPALVDPAVAGWRVTPPGLGLRLENDGEGLTIGRWYRVRESCGMFASVMEARFVPHTVSPARPLDRIESGALVYSVAFDLARFDLGYALGTDHPRVGWSERVLASQRDESLPGPDGIDSTSPLVRTGQLNPIDAGRVAATFVGGFKRIHGAFRSGPLAKVNQGSHYGFVEQGVLFSKLQPGLATVVVYDDGLVDLKTWTEADTASLPRIRHARQNGVALIEHDESTGLPAPGPLVGQWGPGNWSGSAEKELRTVRAGLCLQETRRRRFLIYSYFSSATPSAMAHVFQAYGCRYAMLLDMNALEHTYLALYHAEESRLLTQHLIEGMSAVDRSRAGEYVPRFIGFADNRDFFYLLQRRKP